MGYFKAKDVAHVARSDGNRYVSHKKMDDSFRRGQNSRPCSFPVAEPDRLAFPIKIRNIDFMCGSICISSGISSHLHKRAVFSAAEEIRRIKEPRAPLRNFTLAAQELLRGPRGAHSCGVIPHPPLPPSHPRPPGPESMNVSRRQSPRNKLSSLGPTDIDRDEHIWLTPTD